MGPQSGNAATADEAANGFFVPVTTWQVTGAGAATQNYTITGDEVDLLVCNPQLTGTASMAWNDVDGSGLANTGDSITSTVTVTNSGTVTSAELAAGQLAASNIAATGHNGAKTAAVEPAAAARTLPVLPPKPAGSGSAGSWPRPAASSRSRSRREPRTARTPWCCWTRTARSSPPGPSTSARTNSALTRAAALYVAADTIAQTQLELISLCVGIHGCNAATFSERTYAGAASGFIAAIRRAHPEVPIVAITPVLSLPREDKPNAVGWTLADSRQATADAVAQLQCRGDRLIHLIAGAAVFTAQEAFGRLPDTRHPDTAGLCPHGGPPRPAARRRARPIAASAVRERRGKTPRLQPSVGQAGPAAASKTSRAAARRSRSTAASALKARWRAT